MLRVGLLYDRRPEGTAVTELESVIPFSESIKPRGIVGDQFRHCRDFVVTVHRSRPDLKALTLLRLSTERCSGWAPSTPVSRRLTLHPSGWRVHSRLIRGALRQRGIS